MQLYIAIDGEKKGPFSLYSVIEMLEDGQVPPESLGWYQGCEKWMALQEMPALDSTIKGIKQSESITEPDDIPPAPPPQKAAEIAENTPDPEIQSEESSADPETAPPRRKAVLAQEVRPFTRFWARIFDYMLVYTVVWMIAGVPIPVETSSLELIRNPEQFFEPEEILRLTIVAIGAFTIWHAIEAILIHTIGTTPGKALFSIRVRRFDGGRPKLTKTLLRSYYVWLAGFGLGIFPFNLIGMAFSFFRLLSTGTALWDKQLRLYVQHAPIGPARILLAVAAFALLMMLQQFVFA